MNIAESDTDIDTVEEVQDVVTTDLKGDKIERLLYKSGLDSEHKIGEEGVSVLEIRGDTITVIMSETWEADGLWYIDPNNIVLDFFEDGEFLDTHFPEEILSEEDLVAYVDNTIEFLLS